ncbi:MAG TPA: DUF3887 domain-containing protein [Bryobacteraceae bacterium]|nr:DUF3887 domain-containing protein [Bryobacteraceae bacterium]
MLVRDMVGRFVFLVASVATFLAFAQQGAGPVPIARKALDLLLAGQYHELRAMFSKQMLDAVTEDMLTQQIGAQIKAWGKAEKIGDPIVQHVQNVDAVIFPIHFSTKDISIIIPIDAAGKVAGLRFGAPPPAEQKQAQWTAPPYGETRRVSRTERDNWGGCVEIARNALPTERVWALSGDRAGAWFGAERS